MYIRQRPPIGTYRDVALCCSILTAPPSTRHGSSCSRASTSKGSRAPGRTAKPTCPDAMEKPTMCDDFKISWQDMAIDKSMMNQWWTVGPLCGHKITTSSFQVSHPLWTFYNLSEHLNLNPPGLQPQGNMNKIDDVWNILTYCEIWFMPLPIHRIGIPETVFALCHSPPEMY